MNQNNYKDSMLLHNNQRKAPSDQSYTETNLMNQETPLNPPQVHGVGTALKAIQSKLRAYKYWYKKSLNPARLALAEAIGGPQNTTTEDCIHPKQNNIKIQNQYTNQKISRKPYM